jgi:hypothetical protein
MMLDNRFGGSGNCTVLGLCEFMWDMFINVDFYVGKSKIKKASEPRCAKNTNKMGFHRNHTKLFYLCGTFSFPFMGLSVTFDFLNCISKGTRICKRTTRKKIQMVSSVFLALVCDFVGAQAGKCSKKQKFQDKMAF